MSGENETFIVCPDDESDLVNNFTIAIGVLTVLGTVIAFFVQQWQERKDAAEAKIKEDEDLDRQQALERVRMQISVLVGPLQRLWKVQTILNLRYRRQSGHGSEDYMVALRNRGQAYWTTLFQDEFLQKFIEDPHSFDAILYRNFITRRAKPIYTRLRELVLAHMSNLADMPTQEEWLEKYSKEDIISPHTGSVNINVIFDSYVAYTFEFDDIIESWAEGDFQRMQPTTVVPWLICNALVDLLFENAREKEARYNKHVTIHKNTIQEDFEERVRREEMKGTARRKSVIAVINPKETMGKAREAIEERIGKAKEAIEDTMEKAKDMIDDKMGKEKDNDNISQEDMGIEKDVRLEEKNGNDISFEGEMGKESIGP